MPFDAQEEVSLLHTAPFNGTDPPQAPKETGGLRAALDRRVASLLAMTGIVRHHARYSSRMRGSMNT